MEQDKLHILITGEQGQGRSFAISRQKATRAIIIAVAVVIFLVIGSITGITFISKTIHLSSKNKQLDAQLAETMSALDKAQADRFQLVSNYEENIERLEEDRENLLEGSQNVTAHVFGKIIIIYCCAVMAASACGSAAVSCGSADQEVFI